ncbi:MAG TPA: hypothetical protein VHZ03_40305 [Trebonia sp.]|nr:hypothetical protein [Trebonia sp.]
MATLAMGICQVAPGPSVTPMPLMSAAETPAAGHETAPSCFWLGVAVPARGVTGPEGEVPCAAGYRCVPGPVRFDSWCQSRQRGVASPYAVFDMRAIYSGS